MCRRLRQLRRSSSGQSLAEFAIVLPLLLTVMFGVFEFGRFYYTRLTLQHAVREAVRFAVTGNTGTDEDGEQMTRGQSIARVIIDKTSNLGVDLESVTIDPADGGGPEEIVRVGVNFEYRLTLPLVKNIVPENKVRFSYSTAMRNEPFYQ